LWLQDLTRGAASRPTSDASLNSTPVWSPDGRHVVFSSNRTGDYDIYIKDVSGGGPEEPAFLSHQYKITSDWSRDGRYILFAVFDNNGLDRGGPDLWVLPLDGSRKAAPYLETRFAETHGQFSPDTRWIAYASNESGPFEIYVRPFPAAPGKWLISVNGGRLPRWRRDGKELYYLSAEGKLMAVSLKPTPGAPPRWMLVFRKNSSTCNRPARPER
jgi:Tol biopolymer transport system component